MSVQQQPSGICDISRTAYQAGPTEGEMKGYIKTMGESTLTPNTQKLVNDRIRNYVRQNNSISSGVKKDLYDVYNKSIENIEKKNSITDIIKDITKIKSREDAKQFMSSLASAVAFKVMLLCKDKKAINSKNVLDDMKYIRTLISSNKEENSNQSIESPPQKKEQENEPLKQAVAPKEHQEIKQQLSSPANEQGKNLDNQIESQEEAQEQEQVDQKEKQLEEKNQQSGNQPQQTQEQAKAAVDQTQQREEQQTQNQQENKPKIDQDTVNIQTPIQTQQAQPKQVVSSNHSDDTKKQKETQENTSNRSFEEYQKFMRGGNDPPAKVNDEKKKEQTSVGKLNLSGFQHIKKPPKEELSDQIFNPKLEKEEVKEQISNPKLEKEEVKEQISNPKLEKEEVKELNVKELQKKPADFVKDLKDKHETLTKVEIKEKEVNLTPQELLNLQMAKFKKDEQLKHVDESKKQPKKLTEEEEQQGRILSAGKNMLAKAAMSADIEKEINDDDDDGDWYNDDDIKPNKDLK